MFVVLNTIYIDVPTVIILSVWQHLWEDFNAKRVFPNFCQTAKLWISVYLTNGYICTRLIPVRKQSPL